MFKKMNDRYKKIKSQMETLELKLQLQKWKNSVDRFNNRR